MNVAPLDATSTADLLKYCNQKEQYGGSQTCVPGTTCAIFNSGP